MRFSRFLLFVFLLLWMLIGCRQSTSPPVKSDITLAAEFTGVTEAWIAIHNPEPQAGTVLQLWRGEHLVFSDGGSITDTTVADSGLAPAQSYRYRARLLKDGALLRTGPELTITTMDTTSHDFTWEVIEFPSPFGSGGLYDVAIINENDIWAVGEIYSDSAKPWLPYNAVHWDGEKWELVKVPFYDENGTVWYTPIYSILAFSKNDIWFEAGVHWNGEQFESRPISISFPSHVNKMWGTSGNDFYIVGDNGLIAHYDGSNWRRIESGTTLPIQDIWGGMNERTGDWEILAVASNHLNGLEFRKKIFYIKNNSIVEISTNNIGGTLYSAYYISPYKYYVAGSGIFSKKTLNKKAWKNNKTHSNFYIYRIRGNNVNNIFAVGGFGEILHYNGLTWKSYFNQTHIPGNYHSLDVKENIIVVVGYTARPAALAIGYK